MPADARDHLVCTDRFQNQREGVMTSPAAVARSDLLWFGGLCILGLALAWLNRFVLDDAFISFLYARQLVEGHGLTWFGSYVEGYSNFLWVLWIALGLRVGSDPIAWAHLGSMASYGLLLYSTWRLTSHVFDSRAPRVIALALLITNYTVSAFATSGLETMTQTALLAVAVWQFYEQHTAPRPQALRLASISLVLALAVLLRMDSALPGVVIILWTLVRLYRSRAPWPMHVAVLLPSCLLIGSWLIWKQAYYGGILPNSFYAKVGTVGDSVANGLLFVGRFLHWYLIWPVLAVGVVALAARAATGHLSRWPGRQLWPHLLIVCLWLLYVVRVGGDFMEFRFLVPMAPYFFIVVTAVVWFGVGGVGHVATRMATYALCLVLLVASLCHARRFVGVTADKTLDSIRALGRFYNVYPDGKWSLIGAALRDELGDSGVKLACHAVGAIPFYSKLETIDMYGLNDLQVTAQGNRAPAEYRRPGHQFQSSVAYLKERGVHLVIGNPTLVRPHMITTGTMDATCRRLVQGMVFLSNEPIGHATVVAMPLDEELALFMWYLTPHERVYELVGEGKWEQRRLFIR